MKKINSNELSELIQESLDSLEYLSIFDKKQIQLDFPIKPIATIFDFYLFDMLFVLGDSVCDDVSHYFSSQSIDINLLLSDDNMPIMQKEFLIEFLSICKSDEFDSLDTDLMISLINSETALSRFSPDNPEYFGQTFDDDFKIKQIKSNISSNSSNLDNK